MMIAFINVRIKIPNIYPEEDLLNIGKFIR